jgi:hypothetical protein
MSLKREYWKSRFLASISRSRYAGALNQPVFIVGCYKSAKTLLKHILRAHPDIIPYPGEVNELWHPSLYPWHRSDLSVPDLWVDPHRFVQRSLADWTPRHRMAIKARFGAYQKMSAKPVLLVESAMIAFLLPPLLELFPGARFIHFYRDGRVVAYLKARTEILKIHKHKGRYQKGGGYFENLDDLLPEIASHWAATMAEIQRFRALALPNNPGTLLELSYEQFCATPFDSLEMVFDFLRIPRAHLNIDHVRNTNAKHLEEMGSNAISIVTNRIVRDLQSKGYETSPPTRMRHDIECTITDR